MPDKPDLLKNVPEVVIESAKREIALAESGIEGRGQRHSYGQIVAMHPAWELSLSQLRSIKGRFRSEISELADDLTGKSAAVANMALDALVEKMADPEVVADMTPTALSGVAKMQMDLVNKSAQVAPALTVNFSDCNVQAVLGWKPADKIADAN